MFQSYYAVSSSIPSGPARKRQERKSAARIAPTDTRAFNAVDTAVRCHAELVKQRQKLHLKILKARGKAETSQYEAEIAEAAIRHIQPATELATFNAMLAAPAAIRQDLLEAPAALAESKESKAAARRGRPRTRASIAEPRTPSNSPPGALRAAVPQPRPPRAAQPAAVGSQPAAAPAQPVARPASEAVARSAPEIPSKFVGMANAWRILLTQDLINERKARFGDGATAMLCCCVCPDELLRVGEYVCWPRQSQGDCFHLIHMECCARHLWAATTRRQDYGIPHKRSECPACRQVWADFSQDPPLIPLSRAVVLASVASAPVAASASSNSSSAPSSASSSAPMEIDNDIWAID